MAEPQTAPPAATPAPPPVRRIFTATGVIGVPGSGKTTLADGFSVYLWETFKKVLLLYSWDGGAIPTQIQKRMQQGLIRYWRARTRSGDGLGIETVYLASKGYWPKAIDPQTGETSPAVELVAPVTTRYALSCPKGHPINTVQHHVQIIPQYCAECRAMVQVNEYRIAESVTRTKGFELVGGVFFDGLTSMCNVVMDHMDISRGAGLIGGEKPAFGGVVASGVVKMGGNNRADIGFGQSRAQQFVNNSLSIPSLVEGPVFTGLAMEATDEGGLPIVGMKLPGRAATDEASAWFGNMMEMGRTLDDAGKEHVTLFLRPFTDKQNRRHLLKTSSSPIGLPDMLIDPPLDEKKAGVIANLGDVFRGLDADLKHALATDDVKDTPGMAGSPTSYGETIVSALVAAVTQAAIAQVPTPAPATPAAPAAPTVKAAAPRMPPKAKAAPAAAPKVTPIAESAGGAIASQGATAGMLAPDPPPQAAAPPPPTTGTTPPPPPGMRPPQKAPGA